MGIGMTDAVGILIEVKSVKSGIVDLIIAAINVVLGHTTLHSVPPGVKILTIQALQLLHQKDL